MNRMPNHDIRNDGIGPYAVFYCERCSREYRSQPNIGQTIAKDLGRDALGGALRGIPLFGSKIADNVVGEDPRYIMHLTPQQLDAAWKQLQVSFRECPTCQLVVCLSDWDARSGYCNEDSPRKDEIAEAEGQQAGAALKGLANAFGLGGVMKQASEAVKAATTNLARCPNDGTTAPAGTRFCPECGTAMVQPASALCPGCGTDAKGAKFCPECGTRVEQPPAVAICPSCGIEAKGAKFCPECGTRVL
jgi:hypothetical protein